MPAPIPPPDSSGFTTSTDVPLYWAAYGEPDAPPLLVLHGGPGADQAYLLPQMLRLMGPEGAASRRLLFYDQRGGGQSKTHDRTPITWRTHVEDLRRVTVELGVEEPSLVGYSWGGLLAMLYAIETAREGAPRRLVLVDPAPVTREYRARFEGEFARRQGADAVRAMREELAASGLRERDPAAYRQRAFELSVAGYFADPRRARDLTPFRVVGRVQQSVWESLGDYDLIPRLGAIQCPTLVVHGREDPIPLASSEAAARAIPGASLVILDDCGHVPYVEAPDALFAAVDRFLLAASPHHGSHA
ncbi:MAG TPA: alpha/beta hydrolase [Gemmatimonadaceae bacterium]|nr:alpha/beta hydrolase [Gemmatimonadaceae bacterium]